MKYVWEEILFVWVYFVWLCPSKPQLHNAANANQKEKYEADLKKEIKKLQVGHQQPYDS